MASDHLSATIARVAVGAVSGVIVFFVSSYLSFWSLRGGEAIAPILLFALALAVVYGALNVDAVTATAGAASGLILLVIGYMLGIGGRVPGALALEPVSLMLHGGHSGTVAVTIGAVVAAAIVSVRASAKTERAKPLDVS